MLKPGFFSNEALCDIHPFGRLLFAGLWTLADREGRLPDRAKVIKGALFPYENVPVEKLLVELEIGGFIMRYTAEEERYIQVVKFKAHQHVHKNEAESIIPPFNTQVSQTLVRNAPVIYGSAPVISQPAPAEAEAEAEAVTNTEAEAETRENDIDADVLTFTPDTNAAWPDDPPPAITFVGRYVREHQLRHAGNPPSPVEQAAAKALERDFGAASCIETAADFDWQKHPNYLREVLNDPNRGKRTNGQSRSAARGNGLSPSDKARLQLAGR